MKARDLLLAACLVVALAGPPFALAGSTNVEVIVNDSLYAGGMITASLDQYLADIRSQGYNPILTTTPFASAEALRTHLSERYTTAGLAGAVLVGDLPARHYERYGQYGDPNWHEVFPCDLYLEDLNGSWGDVDGNGNDDVHTGNVTPEIWVARLPTSRLTGLHPGRTEASLLNQYFAKDHAYRQGLLRLPRNGLAYVDDDWAGYATQWGNALASSLAGTVTVVSDGTVTTTADYVARLHTQYESLLLAAHSSATMHRFKIGSEWEGDSVGGGDLADINPQVFFYNLYACSNCNYETDGFMGGEYVFGTELGLAAVGSTKTGSMIEMEDYYQRLGDGEVLGEALRHWWRDRAAGGFTDDENQWIYGMTLLGDPLLTMQQFVPEPAALTVLALGALLPHLRPRPRGRRPPASAATR